MKSTFLEFQLFHFSAANGKANGVAKKLQNEESSSEDESEEEEAPKKAEGNTIRHKTLILP